MSTAHPTRITIDHAAAAHNIRRLRELAGVPVMAVVKANAYGHGAVPLAQTFLHHGAGSLAVAAVNEARTLREAGITAPMLLLGYLPPELAAEAVSLGLTCAVYDWEVAEALSRAAVEQQRPVSVHVKVDTGMGRLGLPHSAADQPGMLLHHLAEVPGVAVEGLFTHLAAADERDQRFTHLQLERFHSLLAELTAAGLRPPVLHAANSAATLHVPASRFDLVRPGIASYGLHPSPDAPLPADFRPVLSLATEVAQVKQVPAGTPLSYGCTYVTPQPATIATLPIGYADGLRRSPPWREVLLHGVRAPIVGRICMDYCMVDASRVAAVHPVRRGDPVVLIGAQTNPATGGVDRISAEEVAGWLGTINYEVVAALLTRAVRLNA